VFQFVRHDPTTEIAIQSVLRSFPLYPCSGQFARGIQKALNTIRVRQAAGNGIELSRCGFKPKMSFSKTVTQNGVYARIAIGFRLPDV